MKITDTRNKAAHVYASDLVTNSIYVDSQGRYIYATDEPEVVVDLSTGIVFDPEREYTDSCTFTPVKARMEIFE